MLFCNRAETTVQVLREMENQNKVRLAMGLVRHETESGHPGRSIIYTAQHL